MNETAICTIGNRRKQLTEKMNLQLIHSTMKEVLETKEELLSKKDFWESHQCRKISYDLLHGRFTPGPNFRIDTELQKVQNDGFYALFPEHQRSDKGIDKRQVKKKERLQACWRFLFLNSFWAIRENKIAISISMNKNHYEKSGKYYCMYWGYPELKAVTEIAVSIGYYKKFPGRQRGEGEKSYITRLELLDGFFNLLEKHIEQNKISEKGSLPEDFTVDDLVLNTIMPRPEKPLLVIRLDEDNYEYDDYSGGIKIPSISSSDTKNIYNNVKYYNEYMNKQQIIISVNIDSISQDYLDILYQAIFRGELTISNKDQLFKSNRRTISVNLLRKIYRNYKEEEERERDITHQLYPYRNDVLLNNNNIIPAPSNCNDKLNFALWKFHSYRSYNSNLNCGGRFYGIVHQQLSKEIRLDTMINGQPVVELDYKALHPSLLYSFIGKQPPKEIYMFEDKEDARFRKLVKIIALVMFNADNERESFAAIRKGFYDKYKLGLKNEDIKPFLELFFEENPDLRQFYLKGLGRKLQNQDSNIMARILTNLRKQAIPAIPIHDSVIVPAVSACQVQETMVEAYQHITKTSHVPFITIEQPQNTM